MHLKRAVMMDRDGTRSRQPNGGVYGTEWDGPLAGGQNQQREGSAAQPYQRFWCRRDASETSSRLVHHRVPAWSHIRLDPRKRSQSKLMRDPAATPPSRFSA